MTSLVLRRDAVGIVLPARFALPAGTGRLVLLPSSTGTTPEQRLVAVAIAGLLAPARHRARSGL